MAQEAQLAPGQQNSGVIHIVESSSERETAALNQDKGASSDGQHPEVAQPEVDQPQAGKRLPEEEVVTDDLLTKQCESLCNCYQQRALALERAANARKQAEGLQVQLAQSQAHAKQLSDAWERRLNEVETEYSQRVAKLCVEADSLRAQLGSAEQHLNTSKRHCEELGLKNHELECKLTSLESSTNEDLQMPVDKSREYCNRLIELLTEERHRNRQLADEAGVHQQQIAILEAQLEEKLLELKHKDEVLEMFGTNALERIAGAVGPSGRADLLRLIAVLKGSSWLGEEVKPSVNSGESGKCDSGYQGSVAGGSSVQKASVGMISMEEKAAMTKEREELKREIRRHKEKIKSLLRLEQMRRNQVHVLEDSLDADLKRRLSSTGFVPACTVSPLPGAVRKVMRKERQLSSTPRVALETLSDVSSISQEVADDTPGFQDPSSEKKDASGSVFVWDLNEKRNQCSSMHREVFDETPRFKPPSSETKDATGSILLGSSSEKRKLRPNRTDWRVSGSGSGTQYVGSDFKVKAPGVKSNRTLQQSQYVQTDRLSVSGTKAVAEATVTDGYKSKARRSLNFAQQGTVEETMPFSFSSNSSVPSSNVAQVSLTFATPILINISSIPQACPADVAT